MTEKGYLDWEEKKDRDVAFSEEMEVQQHERDMQEVEMDQEEGSSRGSSDNEAEEDTEMVGLTEVTEQLLDVMNMTDEGSQSVSHHVGAFFGGPSSRPPYAEYAGKDTVHNKSDRKSPYYAVYADVWGVNPFVTQSRESADVLMEHGYVTTDTLCVGSLSRTRVKIFTNKVDAWFYAKSGIDRTRDHETVQEDMGTRPYFVVLEGYTNKLTPVVNPLILTDPAVVKAYTSRLARV